MMGKTEPRIWTPPLRELTPDTSLGFACVEYARTVLRKNLYPWQEWALIHALEITGDLGADWLFRFRTVLFLISRQNGKTVLSEVIASFFLNVLCVDSIFGTSLSLDKAEEVWEAVVQDQESVPELSAELQRVGRTNGSKKLVLTGLRQYKVGAPTRRAGRGDSNDLVMLDEIREQRDWETWSASVASTNAKPNGMVVCFSNAGDPDSIVLRELRSKAIALISGTGSSDDFGGDVDASTLGLFEWSAEDGAATDDIEQLAQANPALGYGYLTERALMSNRGTFPEAKFRSECMCQQVETILPAPFPGGSWSACLDLQSAIAPESELYYGIDLSADRRWASVAVCGMRADGNYHIEVVARRVGTAWCEDWFRTRAFKHPMNLSFQSRGAPVTGLAEQLCTLKGVNRIPIEGGDLTAGWGRFYDAIIGTGSIRVYHLQQPVLDLPAKTMQLRNIGGGIELPDRAKSPDDIAPLFACFAAFAAATKIQKDEKKIYASAYASGAQVCFV
jgi:phage terminase large subunit-like protein